MDAWILHEREFLPRDQYRGMRAVIHFCANMPTVCRCVWVGVDSGLELDRTFGEGPHQLVHGVLGKLVIRQVEFF